MEAMSRHTSRTVALLATVTAAALAALAFGAPGSAQAKCGQTRTAKPANSSGSNRPPLVIGDSVLYDVVGPLARRGFEANGMICRTMAQGLAIMKKRRAQGTLPHMVVLQLGANGRVTTGDVKEALRIAGPKRVLVMLTPTDDDPPRGIDARPRQVVADISDQGDVGEFVVLGDIGRRMGARKHRQGLPHVDDVFGPEGDPRFGICVGGVGQRLRSPEDLPGLAIANPAPANKVCET